jgi:processive 1,2-diacylglycerol beta-glucosyltransferase
LKAAWEDLYPEDDISVEDILESTNPIFRFIYSKGYLLAASKLPLAWRMMYYGGEDITRFKPPSKFDWAIRRLILGRFVKKMNKSRPDIIVSTHFLASDGAVILKKQKVFDFLFSIVTTDYGLHSAWISPHTNRYFVPTPNMRAELLTVGEYLKLQEKDIRVTGIPIHPKYVNLPSKKELREKFHLDPDIFTLLVFRGVFSNRNFNTFVKYVSKVPHPLQLIMVAGKEWPIPTKIKKIFVENNIAYRIFGYIDFMEELMALSDLVVTKSGGLTTSECLATKTPLAIYRPYPGQEERNAEYLMEQGAGFKINQLAGLPYRITDLIENRDKHENMSQAAERISSPKAAYKIVKDLKGLGTTFGSQA